MGELTFIGGEELDAAFAELEYPRDMRNAGRRALRVSAKPILLAARQGVPVDTGLTQRDIKIRNEEEGISVSVGLSAGKGGRAYIGRFIEFGTVKKSARPFLRPAMDENAQDAVDILGAELWMQIAKQMQKFGG